MADYLGMGEQTSFPAQVLSQQAAKAQIAHQQASTQYINQLARHSSIQADEAQLDYDADKQVAELNKLSQDKGEDQDPMETLTRDATFMIRSGRLKKGADLLKAAGDITTKETTAAARAMDAQTRAQQQKMKTLGVIEQAFANATDEQSWQAAKDAILQADPSSKGMVSKLGDYTPEKAAYYQKATTSYKDQMKIKSDQRRNDILESTKTSEDTRRKALTEIQNQELKLKKQREDRLAQAGGKNGNKPAGMASKDEVAGVQEILDGQKIDATPDEVSGIAQEARSLWKKSGMTPQEAAYHVIAEKIKAGDIKPPSQAKGGVKGFFGMSEKGKVVASATKPLTAPLKDGRLDLTQTVKGQYYLTPKGVAKYLGNGKFAIVDKGVEEGGLPETPEGGDEGEEE